MSNGRRGPLRVAHLVSAMGEAKYLWGKENVIYHLMHAQRDSGDVEPQLLVFTPCLLAERAAKDGFPVRVLEQRHRRLSFALLRALRTILSNGEQAVLHTHDYKANIVGRIARAARIPMASLVSSCYGWINETPALRLYQALDRWTSGLSYAVTAPDEKMLGRFPAFAKAQYVPNGIPDANVPSQHERARARAAFGWNDDTFVVGTLGRLSAEKGTLDLVEAARLPAAENLLWAVAGAGPLESAVRAAEGTRLRYVGYVDSSQVFLAAVDVFIQPSRTEGLSLSLLEAMRSQLPIVATAVGATELAIRHEHEGLLIPPRDPDQLVAAVCRLEADRDLSRRLAVQARGRFQEIWRVESQHRAFHDLYLRSLARS
jgi:glycosyltransferase involved in cell wall biosynthesis